MSTAEITSVSITPAAPQIRPDPAQMLRLGFRRQLISVLRRLRKARYKISTERVHDLRVATRRMLALMELIEFLPGVEGRKRFYRKLREIFRATGDYRSACVGQELIKRSFADTPGALGFRKKMKRDRDRAKRRLKTTLKEIEPAKVQRRGKELLEQLQSNHDLSGGEIQEILDTLGRKLRTAAGAAPTDDPKRLHQFRLQAKHVRYLAECFPTEEFVSPEDRALLEPIQDLLGTVHDLRQLQTDPRCKKQLRKALGTADSASAAAADDLLLRLAHNF